MKKLHLLAIVALITIGLTGCEKATVENVASADVFVKAIKNGEGIPVFTPIHSVFSYNKMSSVSVTSPDGGSPLLLTNFENGGNSFFNEPADTDFITTPPASGSYSYLVKFDDGDEKTYTNLLSSTFLLPANITTLAKSADGDSVYISWDAIANTHAYQLKIMKQTTQISATQLFTTPLKIGIPLTSLTSSGSGIYTFELTGFLFETTQYDYLQAISTATQDIEL